MASFIVTIHESRFIVAEATMLRLRADVRDAVRAGGDFVDFRHEEGEAAALVSAATHVVIRRVPEAQPGIVADESYPADRALIPVIPLRRAPLT
ncbi:hypothetical protein B5808_03255 [Cnuibacter physcomitrellae]|uniref:Uncharacterized protein n=1 Tax=Cnuibacter physcomitrellae TaxID=1619308 RepID=A0A1X9LIL2_9MICO|nr:hypothetical protein [Cnuibacter physcomitrellae]ARJ04352.1 hypothetical protein B5808_03255 [Cnuibacter physcomitrellae]